MKKILVLAVLAVFSFSTINAQDENSGVDKVVDKAKNGGFYILIIIMTILDLLILDLMQLIYLK